MVLDMILHLLPIAVLPIVFSLLFYFLEKKTSYAKWPYAVKQILCGIVFGGIAILATTFGYNTETATVNVRDAAPICAGLLFGAPAGILAGLIGGVERYLATIFFGAAKFSQLACTIATCLSGICAGLLRKFLFENRRPSALMSFSIAIVIEVIHLNLLFLTNLNDPVTSFKVVSSCTVAMLACNGISVFLAVYIVKLVNGDYSNRKNRKPRISQALQKYMLIFVCIAFICTTFLISALQTGISNKQLESQLKLALSDINDEILEQSDLNLLERTIAISELIESRENITNQELDYYTGSYNVGEINIVDNNGIIIQSTNRNYVGFDFRKGEQSAEFLALLDENGPMYLIQPYQPISYNNEISAKYGAAKTKNGFVQVGYDYDHFKEDLLSHIVLTTSHRHIGESGFLVVVSPENTVVSAPYSEILSQDVSPFINQMTEQSKPLKMIEMQASDGITYKCMYMVAEGYYVIAAEPIEEALFSRNVSIYINLFLMILIFSALFYQIYYVIKRNVLNSIQTINGSLAEIVSGHLDTRIDVRNNLEFSRLSDDINSTVDTLKHYISEAETRINAELEFARQIQYSSLPNMFPAYPSRDEFDIYATMDTAKEVGGDFYDFYFTDKNRLLFMVADVSGKGIPAAMFMMRAKGIIKSLAQTQTDLAEIMETANNKLCEGNTAGLFITAWTAEIDLETGNVNFVNCGHNPPLVRHANGEFEFLRSKPGFVLAGMENIRYRKESFVLDPGSALFLYTDGVNEATDSSENLYGNDRLLRIINSIPHDADCQEHCRLIRADMDSFTGDAPQFDDITMLMFKFFKKA